MGIKQLGAGELSMNIIMNVCILVMSLFLTVAVLGCVFESSVEEEPTAAEEPTATIVIGEPVTVVIDDSGAADPEEPVNVEGLPVHKVIDGKLERGSRVKVTNTVVKGVDKRLPIRESAGVESPIIGSAAEGATGTILGGPNHDDGWGWWEIAWDDKGKVAFTEGENCCIGWSTETNFSQDVRYLTEIR